MQYQLTCRATGWEDLSGEGFYEQIHGDVSSRAQSVGITNRIAGRLAACRRYRCNVMPLTTASVMSPPESYPVFDVITAVRLSDTMNKCDNERREDPECMLKRDRYV